MSVTVAAMAAKVAGAGGLPRLEEELLLRVPNERKKEKKELDERDIRVAMFTPNSASLQGSKARSDVCCPASTELVGPTACLLSPKREAELMAADCRQATHARGTTNAK